MQVLSVSSLTRYLKAKFEHDPHLKSISIKGEISNFVYHTRSGHAYFQLKDSGAQIKAVMFKSRFSSVGFAVKDGMEVIVEGQVSVYEQSGVYQLYVNRMEQDGVGQLYLQYEQLKKKLELEGLFAQERKRTLPYFIKTVALITSPTGAAVQDMIRTIRRRSPIVKIVIIPAVVQGNDAPNSLVNALHFAYTQSDIECIIIGRGGGSIEDLWAFNDEQVVRTVAQSPKPIISAVGHETDFVLTDFVADMRAETPTAAATFVTNVEWSKWVETITLLQARCRTAANAHIEQKRKMYEQLIARIQSHSPQRYKERQSEHYYQLHERLVLSMQQRIKADNQVFQQLQGRIRNVTPLVVNIKRQQDEHKHLHNQLLKSYAQYIEQQRQKLSHSLRRLNDLNPLEIMQRGYGVVYNEQKEVITSVEQVQVSKPLTIALKDGQLHCKIEGKEVLER
ncbi:MAG: exodeoxyribonuclease VII large subunit [Bacilli bacterium]